MGALVRIHFEFTKVVVAAAAGACCYRCCSYCYLPMLTVSLWHFQILCSVSPAQIPRLSSCDDEIYAAFRKMFPDMKVDKL